MEPPIKGAPCLIVASGLNDTGCCPEPDGLNGLTDAHQDVDKADEIENANEQVGGAFDPLKRRRHRRLTENESSQNAPAELQELKPQADQEPTTTRVSSTE